MWTNKNAFDWSYSEQGLRKCLSLPPSLEDRRVDANNVPVLSSLDLHSNYWDTPNSTSSEHQPSTSRTPSPSPRQICFFVGSEDEAHGTDQWKDTVSVCDQCLWPRLGGHISADMYSLT